jgi:hypothetical protein
LKHFSLKKHLASITGALLLFFTTTARCEDTVGIDTTSGVFRTTFEALSLPANEDLGLAGGTFLYETADGISVGPGFYGALTGDLGGFITLGLAGELKKEINDRLAVSAGLFVGAGGGHGGHDLSGGGFMLRPHAGITLNLRDLAHVGVGISHVEFPNGSISSTQPYIALELPFEVLIDKGWPESFHRGSVTSTRIPSSGREISLVYRYYQVSSNARTTTGTDQHKTIGLMGARWRKDIAKNIFLHLEAQGALQGESNGFMQILMGAGYRLELAGRTHLVLSAGTGVGGGGAVDTGGGFLVNGELALQQYLTDALYLAVSGGYIDAPDGSFGATTAGLELGYRYNTPVVQKGTYQPSALSGYNRNLFRVRVAHQTYLKGGSDDWRLHHQDESVDNLGLHLDYFPTRTFYITGQGMAAYGRGHAGAYMSGLLGAGLHYPLGNTPLFVDLEALAGAAGGGGLAVGGGFVWQTNAGVGIDLTDAFSLIITAGYIDAPGGDFEATVVGASLGFKFGMFSSAN